MRGGGLMRAKEITVGLLAKCLFAMLAIPLGAQSAPAIHPFSYDASSEVKISGAVSSVLLKPASGMVFGSHLLLTTSSGAVDVSLGRFGLRGKGAISLAAGQHVEVTGVMKTIKDQQVFLARTIKVGGETYTIRNEHGIEISPQARPRTNEPGGNEPGSNENEKSELRGNSL